MKIVLISSTVEPTSGWGTLTYNHALNLYRRKIPFLLLLPKKAKRINVPFAQNLIFNLPLLPLTFRYVKEMPKIFYLWSSVKLSWQPTIIHSLVDSPYAALGWRLAKRYRAPFIFSAIGSYSITSFKNFPDRQIILPVYNNAAEIIAISQFTAQKIKEAAGVNRTIKILPPAVSSPVVNFDGEKNFLNNNFTNRKIILTVGALRPRKGIDILVKALAIVKATVPEAFLLIVGNGNQLDYLNSLAQSLKITDSIKIISRCSGEELVSFLKNCWTFALTPRYINDEFEGYGLVFLEAGLFRKPVVAADSGGVTDAVIHEKTGLVVPEDDVNVTAEALIKILQDEDLAKKLGEGGLELARERNWDNYINQIIEIYKNAAKNFIY